MHVAYLPPISYLSLHFHGIHTQINPQNWVFCSVRFISHKSLKICPTADAEFWFSFFSSLIRNSHKIRCKEFDLPSASKQISLGNNTLRLTPAVMEGERECQLPLPRLFRREGNRYCNEREGETAALHNGKNSKRGAKAGVRGS